MSILLRSLTLILLGAAMSSSVLAQTKLTVQQLQQFVRSSLQLQHPDKQIGEYLKRVQMAERLDDRTIEELLGEGAGPKTAESLRALRDASRELPKSAPPTVKPPAPVIPPPSIEEQQKIIEEARELSLNYTKRLPDFICTQVTRRYMDPSGLEFYQLLDTVATRLSYFEQKEEYKVISVNGNLSDVDYERLGGATSTGEFGTMLKEIFEPGTRAEFWWERWATLRGRRVYVFGYRVEQSRSKWHIIYDKRMDIVPGYRGLMYIDKDVPMVMRVTLDAETIPASFPIQEAKTVLDYDFTSIADKQFLLPLRAEVKMREGKYLVRNLVEFRNYRKFGAEATITFETPDLLPEDKVKEKPPQ